MIDNSEIIWNRPSSMKLILDCPGSTEDVDMSDEEIVIFKDESPPALLGTGVHAVAAEILNKNLEHVPDLDSFATMFGVSDQAEDFRYLSYSALSAAKNLRNSIQIIAVEKRLRKKITGNIGIHGTPDVVGINPDDGLPVVPDWKSGWNRSKDFEPQLLSYLLLKVNLNKLKSRSIPDSQIMGWRVILWLRYYEQVTTPVTAGELRAFIKKISSAMKNRSVYNPGENCVWCHKRADCKARAKSVQTVTRYLSPLKKEDFEGMQLNQLAELYPRAKNAEAAIKAYMEVFRNCVGVAGDKGLPMNDGTVAKFDTQLRKGIVPIKAIPLLRDFMGIDDDKEFLKFLFEFIGFSKKDLIKACRARFEKGEKGKKSDELMELFEEKLAVEVTEINKITFTKGEENDRIKG